jgi:hypothetical protein
MSASIPEEFMCAVSKRIMLTPVLAMSLHDEYNLEKTVYDIVRAREREITSARWDTFDFTKTESLPNRLLQEKIKNWLGDKNYSSTCADWQADPVLRLKIYGEFQQNVQPSTSFDNLERIDQTTKNLAESCFRQVLEEDSRKQTFVERIDQINRALVLGFQQQSLPDNRARESRWPRVFREPVVYVRRNQGFNDVFSGRGRSWYDW